MTPATGLTLGFATAATALLIACAPAPAPVTGAADYALYCASCHGATGRGDGPAAAGIQPPPSDLTLIARRNGGNFPRLQVMGTIHGYTMGASDRAMPQFAEALDSPLINYDAGDGHPVPTPRRLVELTEYLESIQIP